MIVFTNGDLVILSVSQFSVVVLSSEHFTTFYLEHYLKLVPILFILTRADVQNRSRKWLRSRHIWRPFLFFALWLGWMGTSM